MTILGAIAETEAVVSTTAVESTTAGRFDSARARCSIRPVGNTGAATDYFETPAFVGASSVTTFGLHWEYYSGSLTSSNTLIQCYNSSGTAVFRLQITGSTTLQWQYWDGAAWQNIGSSYSLPTSTLLTLDLLLTCGGSGSFSFYVGGSLNTSGSASMTSVNNIAKVRFYAGIANNSANAHYSQIIYADQATVGWKYHSKPPTADGANTAFTGTYADVDEAVLSDADYITSAVANDVETFTGAAMTLGSGTVKAVVVSMRIKNNGVSPINAQAALRRSSTNYFSSNLPNISAGFGPALGIFETDPSTSAAWTAANASSSATEFGVKAIA